MNGKVVARIATKFATLAGAAGLALALGALPTRAQEFGSPELIAAAKAEGKLVFYTANFAEVEQRVIKEFQKRFPEIKVEMVRAPGGQLITRVKTEAAAGKLIADVVDHSDRALMLPLADMFQDYAPPSAMPRPVIPAMAAILPMIFMLMCRSSLVLSIPRGRRCPEPAPATASWRRR